MGERVPFLCFFFFFFFIIFVRRQKRDNFIIDVDKRGGSAFQGELMQMSSQLIMNVCRMKVEVIAVIF